jgi:hypothetical protein
MLVMGELEEFGDLVVARIVLDVVRRCTRTVTGTKWWGRLNERSPWRGVYCFVSAVRGR